MNQLISNKDLEKYMQILAGLKVCHAKIFTLEELSKHLGVSVRKLSDFRAGKIIDFWLLTQYAGIIGKQIIFNIA